MPPRFAYWTILIDNAPTAFRARDAQDLLPTLAQLRRTNEHVVLKWFSGGQLWESPDAAREARRKPKVFEKRGADWRPGGEHRDPRARFDKKKKKPFDRDRPRGGNRPPVAQAFRPAKPGARKPFGDKRPPVAQAFRPAGRSSPKGLRYRSSERPRDRFSGPKHRGPRKPPHKRRDDE